MERKPKQQFNLVLDADLVKEIDRLAVEDDRSRNSFLQKVLRGVIEAQKKSPLPAV